MAARMSADAGAPRVAVVGLGHMGSAIAERLLEAGYPLSVFNRTPGRDDELVAAGASRLGSAGDALVAADVCVTSLADDDAVLEVICGERGVLAPARPGTTLIDMSTISVDASARVADAAAVAGVRLPPSASLSGNPVAIRGGKAAVVRLRARERRSSESEPLLRAIAPTVRYVGEGERARVVKLALQILIGGTAELLAEALVLGEAAGVDREKLLDVIRASVVGSTLRRATRPTPLVRGRLLGDLHDGR